MSKADKMFEELGYEKTEVVTKRNNEIIIENTELYFRTDMFDNDDRYFEYVNFHFDFISYEVGYKSNFGSGLIDVSIDLHRAIHQKMKELGWLDDDQQ